MDKKRPQRKINTFSLTKLAMMSALLCVLGPLSINIPVSPVPITLSIVAIVLGVYVSGYKLEIISVLIYLLLGAFGVPVFSNFSGGFAKIAGPTGGYMIGYIFLVLISGIFIEKFGDRKLLQFVGIICGIIVCYAFGTVWLKFQANMTFYAAFMAGTVVYIPFDIAKAVICVFLGNKIKTVINKKEA